MIAFHEGLPGAGKSYEACCYHILPALKAGRHVVTNIRGINCEKFAELLDEPVELVEMLVTQIEPAEQEDDEKEITRVKDEFATRTPDGALIVWDEIQDYYPSGNYKLPHSHQKFWTEHRHRGLDIVIMGQDRDDVHKIIRSRIEALTYFLKLKAVGQPNKYKWEHYERQRKGKFEKIGSGVRSYDSQYFGLYLSHRKEGIKSSVYTTGRTNVLKNTKLLTLGVPVAFAAAIYGVSHLWSFFHPEPAPTPPKVGVSYSRAPAAASSPPPAAVPSSPGQHARTSEPEPEPIDYFDRMATAYSVRLSGLISSEQEGKELLGYVEMLDSSYHVKERFTVQDIQALGWAVSHEVYGLLIVKEGVRHVARAWPLDLFGRVDQRTANSLDTSQKPLGLAGFQAETRSYVTVINDSSPPSAP